MRFPWKRIPWITLLLVAALLVGALISEAVKESLSLGGGFAGEGRWWQVLTCHGVHFGWGHFWRDVPALALLSGLIEAKSRATLLALLATGAVVVPAAVLLLEPEILPYRGSSGLVVAAFAFLGGDAMLRRQAGWLTRLAGMVALTLLAAKIWLELTEGRLMWANPEGAVSVSWSAHFGGALVGLLVYVFGEANPLPRRRSVPGKTRGPCP